MIQELTVQLVPALAEIRELTLCMVDSVPAHAGMKKLLKEVVENPGKMLRTTLMLLAAGDAASGHRDELFATAAALEMIHASSLILDDMIDDSPLRRDKPTVQKQYGKPTALCSGDYLLVTAFAWLMDQGWVSSARELMDAVQAACDGEMIQHENLHCADVREEAYLAAIRGKTAYAFLAACRIGCRITGKTAFEKRTLEEFGELLGIMFQLRDDLLDWTAEESRLGKPVNEDFAEGVYTLPAIHVFSQEGPGNRLRALAAKKHLSEEERLEARRLVAEAGGIAYTADYLKRLGARAGELLDCLPAGPYTAAMRDLVRMLEAEP